MLVYNNDSREEKARYFFAPMEGCCLYHIPESVSTFISTHLYNKLQMWSINEGSRVFKWNSSRGSILCYNFKC